MGKQKQAEESIKGLPYQWHRSAIVRGTLFAWHAIGNFLYRFGFAGEYTLLCIGRVLRGAALYTGQLLHLVAVTIGQWLARVAKTAWEDITSPFSYYRKKWRQLQRVRRRARKRRLALGTKMPVYTSLKVKGGVQIAAAVISLLLPVAALAAMLLTAYSLITMQYALAVEVNGEVLGYVADHSVVEGAKSMLRDRIKLAGNQQLTDWQLNPTYTLTSTDHFSTTHQLANEILLRGAKDEIMEATGFYLDGQLYAVTDDGEQLDLYLDGLLAEYSSRVPEEAVVSFVRQVECDPASDDVFFTSSIEPCDELITRLSRNESEEVRIVADGESALEEIAQSYGLELEILLRRNPQLAETEGDFVPPAGSEILVYFARPFLQVQAVLYEGYTETLPYETITQENPDLPKGLVNVLQQGAEGEQRVYDECVYINGEMESRRRIEEYTQILSAPVDEIREVGTKDLLAEIGGTHAGGPFVFPVPDSPYSSRGMSAYHRGMDINAPAGSPIYACAGGTVTTAGWHYSFGNYVVIDHGGGLTTLYAHCTALYVAAGQTVGQGTLIASVGSTGNSTGNHCHLEVAINGTLVDPVTYVGYPY